MVVGMAEIGPMDGEEPREASGYFTRDGEAYVGGVFETEKGRKFGEAYVGCDRCGGSGKWRGLRSRRPLPCLRCDGEGEKFEQIPLYTEADLARLEADRRKRAERRETWQREREARVAQGHEAFMAEHGELAARAKACGTKFLTTLLERSQTWGGLTDPQLAAMRTAVERHEETLRLYAGSRHVGTPGDRIDVEVLCRGGTAFMRKKFKGRRQEEVFVTEMVDGEGNAFVTLTPNFRLAEGDRATLRGTVKLHDERNGWARTQLIRVHVLELVPRPSPPEPEVGNGPSPTALLDAAGPEESYREVEYEGPAMSM